LKTYPKRKAAYDEQVLKYRETHGMGPDEPINHWAPGTPKIPYGPEHNQRPTGLFNGMIAPLAGMQFKGFIWYQGEADAYAMRGAEIYRELFPDLIRCWRAVLNSPDLPFFYVQLPGFGAPNSNDDVWPALRAAQAEAENVVSNAFMTVAIDSGLEHNIHPPEKPLIGVRLAQSALVNAYDRPGPAGGPQLAGADFESDRVIVHFSRIGKGLVARDVELGLCGKYKLSSDELRGFEIACADGVFAEADAVINGDSVVISNGSILAPTAVRYAWKDFPQANLYDLDGLPSAPFKVHSER
jgi:sialate O-acetylesterase